MRMTIAAAALALVAGATGAEACPDWRAQPHFGQIELWAGFRPDPYSRSITAGGNIAVGPMLLGVAKPVHILTASATVRRIVNMTALTVAEVNAPR